MIALAGGIAFSLGGKDYVLISWKTKNRNRREIVRPIRNCEQYPNLHTHKPRF